VPERCRSHLEAHLPQDSHRRSTLNHKDCLRAHDSAAVGQASPDLHKIQQYQQLAPAVRELTLAIPAQRITVNDDNEMAFQLPDI
jgi:hypothetical protein